MASLMPVGHSTDKNEEYFFLMIEDMGDANLAVDSGQRRVMLPDGEVNSTNSRETLDRLALLSPADHEELVRLTSSNPFSACKAFNISNATSDEIAFMVWLPKIGLDGMVVAANDLGWRCERALEAIAAHFQGRESCSAEPIGPELVEPKRGQA